MAVSTVMAVFWLVVPCRHMSLPAFQRSILPPSHPDGGGSKDF
jgi:hypothetical protein